MTNFDKLPNNAKNEFINLSLRLEPENLYQDGERSSTEADMEAEEIFKEWSALEKKYNTSISQDEVEMINHKHF